MAPGAGLQTRLEPEVWGEPGRGPCSSAPCGEGPRGASGCRHRAGMLRPQALLPPPLLLLSSGGISTCAPLPPPLPPVPPTAVMWQRQNPHSLVLAGCRDGDSRSQGCARPRHRWGTKRGGHSSGPGTCPLPCQVCTPKPPQHPLAAEQWAVPGARAWHPTQTRNILQKQRDLKKIASAETQAKREEFPEVPKSLFSASGFQITLLLYSPMCCMLKIHCIHGEKNPHQSKIHEH